MWTYYFLHNYLNSTLSKSKLFSYLIKARKCIYIYLFKLPYLLNNASHLSFTSSFYQLDVFFLFKFDWNHEIIHVVRNRDYSRSNYLQGVNSLQRPDQNSMGGLIFTPANLFRETTPIFFEGVTHNSSR